METYDYRSGDAVNRLSIETDNLTVKQAAKALAAIERIKKDDVFNFFNSSILPVFQDFAEEVGAVLTVEEIECNAKVITIKSSYDLDMTEQYQVLKIVLLLAHDIHIYYKDEEICLSAYYSCDELSF